MLLIAHAEHRQNAALLQSSQFNKGSAFPIKERTAFKLNGLLPPNIQTLEEQVERAYQQYSSRGDDLAKNTFMASMKAQNEVLYYRVRYFHPRSLATRSLSNRLQLLQTHLKEMFSIIYTPTEGEAIQNYSRLFRRPEGCFLNINDQDSIEQSLSNFGREEDVDYIVVSDGEEVRRVFAAAKPPGLTIPTDTWNRGPRRWRNSHFRRQACYYHALRRHTPIATVTGCTRLRNRRESFRGRQVRQIQLT